MIHVTIYDEGDQLSRLQKDLSELRKTDIKRAVAMSLNKTITTVRTATVRELQKELNLKNQKKLRESIRVRKASRNYDSASVVIGELSIGLDDTKNAVVKMVKRVFRGEKKSRRVGKVTFKGRELQDAFTVTINGKRLIKKKGVGKTASGKDKLQKLYAYSLIQEYAKNRVNEIQAAIAGERLGIEFERAINVILREKGLI